MAKLPISRVVDVTVTRADRFPTREGFGIPLILTSQAAAVVDATTRTKLYGTMDEVAVDWDAADEAYKAALAVFSQNPRPKQLKVGWISPDLLAAPAKASVTINPAGAENALTYTADTAGGAGNDISVAYVDPGVANASLSVAVSGSAITVSLATDGSGAITSTASQVKTAIEGNATAAGLVDITIPGTDGGLANGSGVVTAIAKTFLTGGLPLQFGDELDAVQAFDGNWYWLILAANFRDVSNIDEAITWIEARNKQLFLGSNDVLTEDAASALSVAARNKGTFDRTSVFYHTDAGLYFDAAASGYTARRNFDEAGSAYTLKFKRLRGITPIDKNSAVVQAITGFVPQLGINTTDGHLANAYVEIGGLPMVVEGNVLSGAFIDEIHASDWLIARTQEEILGILATNDRVPMTNTGVHQLVAGVETILQRAFVAGLIADVEDADTGELLPAYSIEVERVEDIPAAQRRNRIAPDIRATFRYAGAVHYSTVRMNMTF